MPWPSDFENILGGVDIAIFNVATLRTDMRPDRKRLLDDLPTPRAFLRGVAGVHSDHLMTSSLSLIFKDVEERAPGGVHDTFCQMMVFDHAVDIEVLDSDMMVLLGVLCSSLEMEITALPLDLQMGLCGALRSFASALRTLLPACNHALLAPERGLALAVVAGVLDGVAFRVREERFQPDIDPNIRMFTRGWSMFLLWFRLTHDESIPMAVSTQD